MKSFPSLRLLLAACSVSATFCLLTSCHTAEGLGEDIQHAGRGIERSAERAHH